MDLNAAIGASTVVGSLVAAIAAQIWDVYSSGMPELADRLQAEGVDIRCGAIRKTFERSFDWAFGIYAWLLSQVHSAQGFSWITRIRRTCLTWYC